MLIAQLHQLLVTPTAKAPRSQVMFWFCLSLTLALTYGILGLHEAFSSAYVVQDDARQHVFWMQRFVDPTLFPNDLIADYFQSVAPLGYSTLYRLAALAGIAPLLFNKFLPVILGLVTTGYCFGVCWQLLPIPAAGFIATLLLNQSLWMEDDLVSATARAFIYPLFLAFLYYLLRRSLLPCLVAIALQGFFYPQTLFLTAGVLSLRLLRWNQGRLRLSAEGQDYRFCAAGLGMILVLLLPYALQPSEYGPVISVAEARQLPEFLERGRARFFVDSPWEFWLTGDRTGLFPYRMPPLILLGILLPFLLRHPSRFPLVQWLKPSVTVLQQVLLASLGMFAAAHILLFKLYLPSRYMQNTLPIVLALATGIVLVTLLDALFQWALGLQPASPQQPASPATQLLFFNKQFVALGLTILLGGMLFFYPTFLYPRFGQNFPRTGYFVGQAPTLYDFLQKQPKDILIASSAQEANNLPTFSRRSILVAREYGVPYHVGYYSQFRQRANDLVQAQYSQDLTSVKNFIQTYGVDFWILDTEAFTPEYLRLRASDWLWQFPSTQEAQTKLEQGVIPVLATLTEGCSALETYDFTVLDATCILQAS